MKRFGADDEFFIDPKESITVHHDDDFGEPSPTGVLDANGYMIYRSPQRIGFVAPKKRVRVKAGRR